MVGQPYIPHSRQKLDESTVSISETNKDVRLCDATGLHVDTTQHEGREGEATQSQRSWVGDLSLLNGTGTVGSRLELSSKRWQESSCGIHMCQGTIVAVASWNGLLGLVGLLLRESIGGLAIETRFQLGWVRWGVGAGHSGRVRWYQKEKQENEKKKIDGRQRGQVRYKSRRTTSYAQGYTNS